MAPRLVFVGNMRLGSNARSLADGFEVCGLSVTRINTAPYEGARRLTRRWWDQRFRDTLGSEANSSLATQLRAAGDLGSIDALVCFKTVRLRQDILLSARAGLHLHYSPDDASNPDNVTDDYLRNESAWDAIVTTKTLNVPELAARGVRKPIFVKSAYDPVIHAGAPATFSRPYRIGFIGARRADRQDLPRQFALNAPDQGLIVGPRWHRPFPPPARGVTILPPVGGDAFSATASSFDVAPVLLNSANRDTHTTRTFEMPACGNLALLPRTPEHHEILEEDSEALFFSSRDEMWEKYRSCVLDPERARRVAAAGQRRILSGRHTYADRARSIAREVGLV